MRLKLKLNLDSLARASFSDTFYFFFDDIANMENWHNEDENVTALDFYQASNYRQLYIYLDGNDTPSYDERDQDIEELALNGYTLKFECTIADSSFNRLVEFIEKGIIELDIDGITSIYVYRLNDEKDKLNKNLIPITIITGTFKAPLGIKNIEIDVVNYDIDNSYNYIFIPKLKRYYYVINIQFVNKEFTRLILQEDVLMSWKELIKLQNAFVTRYEGSNNVDLVDDRFPVEDMPTVTYYTPQNASQSNVVQLKYIMDQISGSIEKRPNVLVSSMEQLIAYFPTDNDNIIAPTGSNLPNIQSRRGAHEGVYLMNVNDYNKILGACLINDAPASFIKSVILLPFDLLEIYPDAGNSLASKTQNFWAGKWGLDSTGFVEGPLSDNAPTFWFTVKGGSPYIVIADFYFDSVRGGIEIGPRYLDFSPNTQWEIYIPFCGWIQIDAKPLYNKRVMIYYTFDIDTGNSTAYIYNKTDSKVVWSGNCQIGMKLLLTTTNAEELARQKNATSLNLIMGLMNSALSIGVGANTGNSNAVIKGLGSIGGNIVSAINSYNSLIERAQMTYGSSDNALYSPNVVTIRKTTHDPIITNVNERTIYNHLNGSPYRHTVNIGSLISSYYMEVGVIHFDAKGYNIYNDEITEIVQLLQNGVIL